MSKKSSKKSRQGSRKKKKGWTSKLVTLLSFLLFFTVLLLVISTLLRWVLPPAIDPVFGRNVIRVEVLNGCGEKGVAERVTDWLREEGFDIVFFGNANSFDYEESVILDRSGRPEFAGEVAKVLGCDSIERRFDDHLLLDVTVIVGGDWEKLIIEADPEGTWESAAYSLRETIEKWLRQ
jgi:hypothetical protein